MGENVFGSIAEAIPVSVARKVLILSLMPVSLQR